jgi:hypothetical protein
LYILLRSDRHGVYRRFSIPFDETVAPDSRKDMKLIKSGETQAGAALSKKNRQARKI